MIRSYNGLISDVTHTALDETGFTAKKFSRVTRCLRDWLEKEP
jgi:hypothetical protein